MMAKKTRHRGTDPFPTRRANPYTQASRSGVAEYKAAKIEKTDAAAALDRMHATRPLTPPPLPCSGDRTTTGARALIHDIRVGAYTPYRRLFT